MELLRWDHQWSGQMKVWNLKIERGQEPPPEYYSRPELDLALCYLHEAFFNLSTERQIGMARGPIPRSKIKEYGRDDLSFVGEELERFVALIGMIDGEYLAMVSAKPQEDGAARDVPTSDAEGTKRLLHNIAKKASGTKKLKPLSRGGSLDG